LKPPDGCFSFELAAPLLLPILPRLRWPAFFQDTPRDYLLPCHAGFLQRAMLRAAMPHDAALMPVLLYAAPKSAMMPFADAAGSGSCRVPNKRCCARSGHAAAPPPFFERAFRRRGRLSSRDASVTLMPRVACCRQLCRRISRTRRERAHAKRNSRRLAAGAADSAAPPPLAFTSNAAKAQSPPCAYAPRQRSKNATVAAPAVERPP